MGRACEANMSSPVGILIADSGIVKVSGDCNLRLMVAIVDSEGRKGRRSQGSGNRIRRFNSYRGIYRINRIGMDEQNGIRWDLNQEVQIGSIPFVE
jgi:hypothetical protein